MYNFHFSKSQIFVQKFNFDKTPTFSRVFHHKNFWLFFWWNQSCQQLKNPKPQHFHEFFTPKKSTFFDFKLLNFARAYSFWKVSNFFLSLLVIRIVDVLKGNSDLWSRHKAKKYEISIYHQWTIISKFLILTLIFS